MPSSHLIVSLVCAVDLVKNLKNEYLRRELWVPLEKIDGYIHVIVDDPNNVLKRDVIEKRYWMQDLPVFLNGNTSMNSYSESGASVGYSYFSLRGFDQRRISILINGVPQNDPEDHQVYWVDLSDITSSVENIQIQRGIGTAL